MTPVRIVRSPTLILIFLLVGSLGFSPSTQAAPKSETRPNILVILADDMGIGDVSSLNPHSAWKTPAIDRLAREGRTFTDAHSASGVCSPSRYTLLTGRYSWRGKLKSSVLHGYDAALLERDRMTVANFLRDHGYHTAMVGKWHLGLDWVRKGSKVDDVDFSQPFQGGPMHHGFDTFLGISASLDMPPYVYLENNRATTIPTHRIAESSKPKMWREGWVGSDFRHVDVHPRFREKTLAWIRERTESKDGKPFFLYLALASPHTPIVPIQDFEGKTRTNPYGDFVTQVDATVNDILSLLDRQGVAKNTLVLFTADNGCSPAANLEELARLGHDPSAGYRGHKADLFEGGHRVPFLVRWPNRIPPGTVCRRTVGQVDLLATFADILGTKLPDSAGEDSVSFLPQLTQGDGAPGGRESLVHQSNNGSFAIRQGEWKLLFTPDSGGWSAPKPGSPESKQLPRYQLYHLETDPSERTNLVSQHPDIVKRLGKRMVELMENGRTTPGQAQFYDRPGVWPQVSWVSDFKE